MKHIDFIETIILELLGEPKDKSRKKLHCLEYIDPIKKCERRERCSRYPDCKTLTMWECHACKAGEKRVYLCHPLCFKIYHMH